MEIDFEDDVKVPTITDEILATAQILYLRELDIRSIKETLDRLTAECTKLKNITLPELMTANNLKELTLDNGAKIVTQPGVAVSITAANKPAAHAWLDKNGLGDIVKTVIKLAFGKGEGDEATECEDVLRDGGYDYTVNESVHASTLKATIKTELEKGTEIPADLFSLHQYSQTTIKMP